MMKVLGLCLVIVLIPVVTAGFFTPSPENKQMNSKGDDVRVVKEGHPGVVIELEKDDNGNTKVSVSPQGDEKGYVAGATEKLDEAKERITEASSSVVPEVLTKEEVLKKEATIGGKAKDTVTRTLHTASEKAQGMKESVKDAASEAASRVKDKVAEKAGDMKQGAKEKAKEAEDMVDRAKQGAGWVKEEGKKESSGMVRRASDVVFRYSRMASSALAGVLHLLGLAVAYGMCVWVTFASKYVLGGVLPRQQFAMVQSKIYPLFFKAMASSIGLALLGHLLGQRKWFPPTLFGMGMLQALNLVVPLVMVLVNLLYLEPRTTKVISERMKKEKEEGTGKGGHPDEPIVVGPAAETQTTSEGGAGATTPAAAAKPNQGVMEPSETLQRRLNTYSSVLNVATLVSLTWHLVHLGQHLHAASN